MPSIDWDRDARSGRDAALHRLEYVEASSTHNALSKDIGERVPRHDRWKLPLGADRLRRDVFGSRGDRQALRYKHDPNAGGPRLALHPVTTGGRSVLRASLRVEEPGRSASRIPTGDLTDS